MGTSDGRERVKKLLFNEQRASVEEDGEVLEVNGGEAAQLCDYASCRLKNGYNGKIYVTCALP